MVVWKKNSILSRYILDFFYVMYINIYIEFKFFESDVRLWQLERRGEKPNLRKKF